jgi:hypothetical protein
MVRGAVFLEILKFVAAISRLTLLRNKNIIQTTENVYT